MPFEEDPLELALKDLVSFVERGSTLAWAPLAERLPGILCDELSARPPDQARAFLSDCWRLLEVARDPIARYCARLGAEPERLYRNALALVAAARVRVEAADLSHEDAGAQLMSWAVKLSVLLDDKQPGDAPTSSKNWPNSDSAGAALDHLAAGHWRVAGARRWIAHCGHKSRSDALSYVKRAIDVPVTGYDTRKKTGFMADLRLELLEGEGELVEHPDMALVPIGRELLDKIEEAWRLVKVNVCWQLTPRDQLPGTVMALDGGSASGPAAVGMVCLETEKDYDSGSLIVGQLLDGEWLTSVEHEAPKVAAAALGGSGIKRIALPGDHRLRDDELRNVSRSLDVVILE